MLSSSSVVMPGLIANRTAARDAAVMRPGVTMSLNSTGDL